MNTASVLEKFEGENHSDDNLNELLLRVGYVFNSADTKSTESTQSSLDFFEWLNEFSSENKLNLTQLIRESGNLLRSRCPNDLDLTSAYKQLKNRLEITVKLLGRDVLKNGLLAEYKPKVYAQEFNTFKETADTFNKLWVVFTTSPDHEGDYDIGFLGQAKQNDPYAIRLAKIGFIFDKRGVIITKFQGSVSSSNLEFARHYGLSCRMENFYDKLTKTLEMKPLNCLIGILMKLCQAKGIKEIIGVEKNLLPAQHISNIHHNCEGILQAVGFRSDQERKGIFSADISNAEKIEKCFHRITGKDPKIKSRREFYFSQTVNALSKACPALFEPCQNPENEMAEIRQKISATVM